MLFKLLSLFFDTALFTCCSTKKEYLVWDVERLDRGVKIAKTRLSSAAPDTDSTLAIGIQGWWYVYGNLAHTLHYQDRLPHNKAPFSLTELNNLMAGRIEAKPRPCRAEAVEIKIDDLSFIRGLNSEIPKTFTSRGRIAVTLQTEQDCLSLLKKLVNEYGRNELGSISCGYKLPSDASFNVSNTPETSTAGDYVAVGNTLLQTLIDHRFVRCLRYLFNQGYQELSLPGNYLMDHNNQIVSQLTRTSLFAAYRTLDPEIYYLARQIVGQDISKADFQCYTDYNVLKTGQKSLGKQETRTTAKQLIANSKGDRLKGTELA